MRWLIVGIIPIVLLLMPVTPALADTSDTVTVTAVGCVVEAPGGFILTYISDHCVGISWTKATTANNTMVRAKIGSYPEDRDDGYLIYYGTGTSANDTAVSLDETATPMHYRAWSENTTGVWSSYAEDNIEGIGVTLIAFIVLVIGLTAILFVTRQVFLGFAAAGGWAVFGAYCYSQSTTAWDIYGTLGFFSLLGMTIVCIYGAYTMRKADGSEIEETDKIGEFEGEEGEEEEPASRSERIRARAEKRRGKRKVRKMLR